jgi:hypothetical protein
MIGDVPFTPFNMVCTNVPGPQFPLYVLGHKMLRWYPYVPIGGELALNCAILSYDGMVYFGFSGDANITPDMTRFEKLLQSNFAELREAAGIKPPQNKAKRKRVRAAKQVAPKPVEKPVTTVRIPISLVGTKPVAESATATDLIFEKKTHGNHVEERIFEAGKVMTQSIA